jgi:nucleoside-diphosphate-sugar epimerase
MVIGNGLIASSFKKNDDPKYIFFASGVSNSSENNYLNFKRERDLLLETIHKIDNRVLIYFSSVSIYTLNSDYVSHKKEMENLITSSNIDYYIFRLPQILGNGGNSKNLINFITNKIVKNDKFNLNISAERSILDIDDLVKIVKSVIVKNSKNNIFDIAGIEFKNLVEIVKYIEIILNKKGNFNIIDVPDSIFKINSNDIELCIHDLSLRDDNYTEYTIKKYINFK